MRFLIVALIAAISFAQEFEVATIKPSPPYDPQRTRFGVSGGPGPDAPGIMTWSTTSLIAVIAAAYEVPVDRIVNPNAVPHSPFDITAKLPAGATKQQVPAMFRKLLEQRFHLAVRSEMRDSAVYVMTVAKSGSKLKRAEENAQPPDGLRTMGAVQLGKDMFPFPSPGEGATIGMNGNTHLAARSVTTAKLAELLSVDAGRPVVDRTELSGVYGVKIAFVPQSRGGVAPPPPMPGGESAAPPKGSEPDTTPTIFAALAQLGLKLDAGKAPVKFIDIDRMDSALTAN
jgi:uncharacterized protein (TIGR03435 family)